MAKEDYQARIAELEGELQKKEQELAAAVSGKRVLRSIPGSIKLTLETPSGAIEEATYGITPGIPAVRIPKSMEIISTGALIKVAAGDRLSEQEAAENPTLVKWGQEGAITFIAEAASKKAGWLRKI